ncbi:hypothetical protein IE53DRAFT_191321 [Violaceomyces palustris]|uniref:Uncharacterized protein n=1 Tax=Violaceomyces palustris TaxID=1673888 RepID=A0ACD0NS33_9BASI|nr:hypothetical protein IE53DRAFT_191321 [Violaceomyces palustris]
MDGKGVPCAKKVRLIRPSAFFPHPLPLSLSLSLSHFCSSKPSLTQRRDGSSFRFFLSPFHDVDELAYQKWRERKRRVGVAPRWFGG